MANFLKQYGDTEGPLGLPMTDKQAFALDNILRALPAEDRRLCRLVTAKSPSELLDGERCDISWITTQSVDREQEIVIARGMDDSQFAGNPLVTLNHCYVEPPVGRSVWRKYGKEGAITGIKAKTYYPARPQGWTDECWPPDSAFALIKSGLMNGKSIGFIRLKSHQPSSHEIAARPNLLANVSRIIDEWLLLEYACTFLPTNQDSLVQAVSKSNIKVPSSWLAPAAPASAIPFTALTEIEATIRRGLQGVNTQALIKKAVDDAYHKLRGGV
jgi:hypothetical protein